MITREVLIEMVENKTLKNTTILYDHNNIVIINVSDYEDCNTLFDDWTCWCIAHDRMHWRHYCSGRKQYFILDFNKLNNNNKEKANKAAIGFTLNKSKIYAAHAKNDDCLLDFALKNETGLHPFEKILKEKGIYKFVIRNKLNISKSKIDYLNKDGNDIDFKYWFICILIVITSFIISIFLLF